MTCTETTARRIALLGASNLTRGFGLALDTARRAVGERLEVYTALGHGRSYGLDTNVLGRGLPPIRDCGLWPALRTAGNLGHALVLDIGNDLLYGAPPELIASWVEECVARLRALGARVTLALLPVESLLEVGKVRFTLARTALFPASRLTYDGARRSIVELNDRLRSCGVRHGAQLVDQRPAWYGLDPIHITRRARPEAWTTLLAGLVDRTRDHVEPRGPGLRRLPFLLPAENIRFLGRPRSHGQPAITLRDGSAVFLF